MMRVLRQLALLLILTRAAAAQQTRPAENELATTPRDAIHALNQAMRTGNVAAMKRLFLATNPAERRMIDADAQMAAALARLRSAAVAAFGRQGADTVTGETDAAGLESASRIDAAEVTISGDVATVTYADEKNSPFVLKKVDGRWRVPVSQLGKPLDPASLDQRLADLAIQRKVVEEIIEKISQKEFPGPERAREAWRTRILEAATSQPATQPASRVR